MNARLARAVAALDKLVNHFIPPSVAVDRDKRNRAHVFLISHILGPFIGNVVPISIYLLEPAPGYDVAVLAASITLFWVFPFILRAGAPYDTLALVSIENLIFCILWSCYFYGGVTSPTLAWVLVIPLLAFFYLGSSSKLRLIVMFMFAANVAVFSVFYSHGFEINNKLPVAAMQGLGLVSTTAASVYVAMMALYYAKIQASQGELESEMRQHMATASALRAATEEAERAGAAKSEFLAKMSHELRTPLNAVIGYSQMLLEDVEIEGDRKAIADLTKIHMAGQHLLKLINEVLDLSKIEAGKMELHLEETDFCELLRDIAKKAKAAVEANGSELICSIPPHLGTALCDSGKFRNVVEQLTDNAAKFTCNGRVKIAARRLKSVAGEQLVVDIMDTGIGIAADQVPKLFEKFTVADDSSTTKYGGTGLGLALSERLCKLMGGEIFVKSELGKGSCFTIKIPLSELQQEGGHYAEATLVPDVLNSALPASAGIAHA